MPYELISIQKKQWYRSPLPWIAVALAASLVLLAMPGVQRRYHRWSETRSIRRAVTCFQAKDYKTALINARAALRLNPHSVEATRIVAKTLEAIGAPDAQKYRQQLDVLAGADLENALALATGAWKAGDPAATERALDSVPVAHRHVALYHELAAKVATQRGDFDAAESHWQEALRIEPANAANQLELAALQLNSKTPEVRTEALRLLGKLSEDPVQRVAALRTLLRDSIPRGEPSRTRELADALVADPQATFTDRLTRLTILRGGPPTDFARELAALQAGAVSQPEQLYHLIGWMNAHNLALMVPEWEATLPPDTLATPQVRAALTDAYARGSRWADLLPRLQAESWNDLEYLRYAYLSRTCERLGDANGAAAAWNHAVAETQANPRQLEFLARTVLQWNWTGKAEEVLWKLAATGSCPRWATDILWTAALKRGDTARLYETSRLMLKSDPKNLTARNNYIGLGLLTAQEADSPHQRAEALYLEAPNNSTIASTYGFSLQQLGRPWEAVAIMNTFPPEELQKPVIAFYQGLFLAAAGDREAAQPYLALGSRAPLLPEERALLEKAQTGAPAAPATELDRTRTDTLQLYRESNQRYLASPQDAVARRNYILLALLTGQSVDSTRQLAREQSKEHPGDAGAAAAYGLALLQKGEVRQAVAVMESLKVGQLREPLIAAYYGIFLAADGQLAKAGEHLALAQGTPLLPEERALYTRASQQLAGATSQSAALDRTRTDTARLYREWHERFLATPQDAIARQNYVLLALLTGQSADAARPLARGLFKDQPGNATAAAAHGLALLQLGQARQAVAVLESLKPEQLRAPLIAAYYGIFLAADGQLAKASEYLALAEETPLLPEEKALHTQAKQQLSAQALPGKG